MVSVFDVADYILHKRGSMTAMKLQKLVYYAQAWSLVWEEKPLFKEKIEAWANGPVVRELFEAQWGEFRVSSVEGGNRKNLNSDQRDTINVVLDGYGGKSSQWLSDLTHQEQPWKIARRKHGLADGQRGSAEISHASMAEYYGSI